MIPPTGAETELIASCVFALAGSLTFANVKERVTKATMANKTEILVFMMIKVWSYLPTISLNAPPPF